MTDRPQWIPPTMLEDESHSNPEAVIAYMGVTFVLSFIVALVFALT